jgi:NADPH-dependent ferric siderophore reductase
MLRLSFVCADLAGFVSASHDDHIKLFFSDASGKAVARDFTPRRFDAARGTLTIDFALHETGPATAWAASARVGDVLEIGGPRGSSVVPDDFDWYVLIGDETALPAMGRRVEELRAGPQACVFAVVRDEGERLILTSAAELTTHWLHRREGDEDAEMLIAALSSWQQPDGDGFIWIAAEASVARSLRQYFLEQRAHPREWIKASGYWKRGHAETHEKIED